MVKAQLEDRKTQTRRLPTRLKGFGKITEFGRSDIRGYDWHFRDKEKRWHDLRHDDLLKVLPWQVGDRLWVRESGIEYAGHAGGPDLFRHDMPATPKTGFYWVRDTLSTGAAYSVTGCSRDAALASSNAKVRPSVHMPRWASRLTDIVTDVRVQRLQEISPADARDEGVERRSKSVREMWLFGATAEERAAIYLQASVWEYEQLWNAINGEGTWDANPWIIALTFTVERRNIDAPARAAA